MMALLYRCRMGSDKMAFFLKRRDGAVEKKEQEAEGVGKHDATDRSMGLHCTANTHAPPARIG